MQRIFKLNETPSEGLRLAAEWKGSLCELTLTNVSERPIPMGDLTLFTAEMPFSPDTEFYGEGYNMLSQYGGTVRDFKLLGSFSDYDHYKFKKPADMHQVYNMLVFYPKHEDPLLIGFSSCHRFNGWIRFNESALQIALNGENVTVAPGETICLEEVYVEQGERNTVLNNFAAAIGVHHPRREFPEIPTGWCSWLVYGPDITAQNIYDNLDAIAANNLDLKYIQIDDGYQAYWGDWFDFTDKFEGGVKQVCLDIKAKGFEPAIWVAPFVAEKDSKLFREHPDWFVKDDAGKPLSSGDVSFGGWRCAPWYILDTTHPEALDYVRLVFRTMREEWQVKYFKLDAIIWEAMPFGHRYDDTKTCVEAYKMGMDAILEATKGDSLILGGNSPMWPSIGKIHAMRVTNDNVRSWWQFTQLARECFHRNWQHNRLWINDPDTVLLQNKLIRVAGPDGMISVAEDHVTKDEFAFNAAYTMASGGMVLSGDDVSGLTKENIELLRKLLPPTQVAAEFDGYDFTVGRAKLDETKTLIYVFNFDDEAKDVTVPLETPSEVFDWLEDAPLGFCEKEIRLPAMRPHYAKVLICTKP